MMPKHILMLLSNEYRPDPRVEKEAEALTEAGHDVTILAWDRSLSHPRDEDKNDITVRRIRTGEVLGKMSLALNYPFFLLRSVIYGLRSDAEMVHAHDLDTLFIGVLISKIRRIPLVYDAHEHYAMMVAEDVSAPVAKVLDQLEFYLVKRADHVVAANQPISDYLQSHSRFVPRVIMNCIDPPEVLPRLSRNAKIIIFYGGALEPLRYLLEIIDAIKDRDDVIFRIAGTGSLEKEVVNLAKSSSNIEFMGYLGKEKMWGEISQADLVIAMLEPSNQNNVIGTPNRLFEAMALGTPILASASTLSGKIVTEEDCGFTIDWNKESFTEVILQLKDDVVRQRKGANGTKAAKLKYNWGSMRSKLLELFAE